MIFFRQNLSKRNLPHHVPSQRWFQHRQVLPQKLLQVDLAILNWMISAYIQCIYFLAALFICLLPFNCTRYTFLAWINVILYPSLHLIFPPCIDRLLLFLSSQVKENWRWYQQSIRGLPVCLPGLQYKTPSTASAESRKGWCKGGSQSTNRWVCLFVKSEMTRVEWPRP